MEYFFKPCLLMLVLVQNIIRLYYQYQYRKSHVLVIKSLYKSREVALGVGLGFAYLLPITVWCFTPCIDFAQYALPASLRGAGIIFCLGGLWCFWESHRALGNNWSPILEVRMAHELVTTGIFAYVRHPMYSSLLLGVVGGALLSANWLLGSVVGLAVGIFILIRLKDEEGLMLQQFGQSYLAYMRKTKRFVPFLW